jgi:hypothetical protein
MTDHPARALAHRLIEKGRSGQLAGETAARAAADACGHLYRELARWVGSDGCHALFSRALALAQKEHAPLDEIQLRARTVPYVEGVEETIRAHGDAETAEALESMLVRVVELLGRLIGDDMAAKLLENSLIVPERGSSTSTGRREEA